MGGYNHGPGMGGGHGGYGPGGQEQHHHTWSQVRCSDAYVYLFLWYIKFNLYSKNSCVKTIILSLTYIFWFRCSKAIPLTLLYNLQDPRVEEEEEPSSGGTGRTRCAASINEIECAHHTQPTLSLIVWIPNLDLNSDFRLWYFLYKMWKRNNL